LHGDYLKEISMQYGLAQAKARLSELTSLVDAGEEVVIAKHGRPSYKLILVSGAQADGSQTAAANQTPTGLEMSRFVAQTRGKSRAPARAENFVAEWRQSARY
jgi:antitoxin (DNA-binding transcriptional repressor) of toxin-antitoxin stability system